jgi:YfiH family protein
VRRNTFTRREEQGIPFYSCCAFEELPGLYHGFSTRHGPASISAQYHFDLSHSTCDSPLRVIKNRRRFLSALNLGNVPLATLRQVHSNRVYIIKDISDQWNQPEGDALTTWVEGVALAVQTADCFPILIADPARKAVAAVHSGWRGTLSRILTVTVHEMQNAFHSDPKELLFAIGPGIRACCLEVGNEVMELFEREFPDAGLTKPKNPLTGKYLLDLSKALDIQLDQVGTRPENRYDLGACTRCNTHEFFSYRAEGDHAGRMMAVIGYWTKS